MNLYSPYGYGRIRYEDGVVVVTNALTLGVGTNACAEGSPAGKSIIG